MSKTALDPKTDILTVVEGTDGLYVRLFTLDCEPGDGLYWRVQEGRTPSQWLAYMWSKGAVDTSRWESRSKIRARGAAVAQYTHDCERCTFLGVWGGEDLYHCPQGGRPTVIARRSSDGPDYSSGLMFAEAHPALGVAKGLAEAKGLPVDPLG